MITTLSQLKAAEVTFRLNYERETKPEFKRDIRRALIFVKTRVRLMEYRLGIGVKNG